MRRGRSFRFRLALAFAAVGLAAALLTAVIVNVAFTFRFRSYVATQHTEAEARLVDGLASAYRAAGGWTGADLGSVTPLAHMQLGAVRVTDLQGRTVWDSTQTDMNMGGMGGMGGMHAAASGPEHSLPIAVDGQQVGTAYVTGSVSAESALDRSFRTSVNVLLVVAGVVAVAVALLLGLVFAKRATAPAVALTVAARALAAGDRSSRVAAPVEDEFGEMAAAFNTMADTVETEEHLRQDFAAAVAHELRTPLAILRSQVEGLQDGVVAPTGETFASLHEEILRLGRLVADLETLASADAAVFTLTRTDVALTDLVEAAVTQYAGLFAAEDITVQTDLDDMNGTVDAARIRQIVANLLSNAAKFTPPGGKVVVTLRQDGGGAVLDVADDGPGIPPDEVPHVFDRFFRGRGARARGSGIGLAVVRELARAHGGDVTVTSVPGNTVFTLHIPR